MAAVPFFGTPFAVTCENTDLDLDKISRVLPRNLIRSLHKLLVFYWFDITTFVLT